MPIAKQVIRDGFTVVALPGGYVSKQAVKDNGWSDLVDDGPDVDTSAAATKDKKAPKGAAQKGS